MTAREYPSCPKALHVLRQRVAVGTARGDGDVFEPCSRSLHHGRTGAISTWSSGMKEGAADDK
jgi:hypothetical protein